MSTANPHLDLTAPEVVRKISQRSLFVGIVFAVISGAVAFVRPDEFYRALSSGIYVLAGRRPRIDGDPHDPAPYRRRLGHGDSPHSGRCYAHICRCWRFCSFR